MQIFRAGFTYFLMVFGAGFSLAFIRIPILVPQFGVRAAELMEAPVMLAVIYWASRHLICSHPELYWRSRLAAGMIALLLFVGAELLVAYALGSRSIDQYIASKDPVSGSVYLASLLAFAVAPAVGKDRRASTST